MPKELLSELMGRVGSLTAEEKVHLATFLMERASPTLSPTRSEVTEDVTGQDVKRLRHRQHLDWLKAHQTEYAEQYVALDGDRLVGHGSTLREAAEAARQQGIREPFLVYVFSPDSVPFGGW